MYLEITLYLCTVNTAKSHVFDGTINGVDNFINSTNKMAKMQNSEKISVEHFVKVTFPQPINNKTEYYFGSLAAIYEVFDEDEIGCKLTTLQANKWEFKATRRCTITKLELIRKRQQNRRA